MSDQEKLYGSTAVGLKEQVIRIEVDMECARNKMDSSTPGDFVFCSEPGSGFTTLLVNERERVDLLLCLELSIHLNMLKVIIS